MVFVYIRIYYAAKQRARRGINKKQRKSQNEQVSKKKAHIFIFIFIRLKYHYLVVIIVVLVVVVFVHVSQIFVIDFERRILVESILLLFIVRLESERKPLQTKGKKTKRDSTTHKSQFTIDNRIKFE